MEIAGIFIVVALLIVLFIGTPIAFGLGFLGVLGTALFLTPAQLSQIPNIAFSQATSSTTLIIPLFILMAEILSCSNIAGDLFDVISRRLKKIPANLAISSILSSAVFSAVCGSSPATAATIGTISIPSMISKGYQPKLAAGVQAAGGTLGILIPPSITFVVYGIITETSIVKLFMAGILPGLMLTLLLIIFTLLWVKVNPSLIPAGGGKEDGEPAGEISPGRDLARVLPVIILILVVLGTLYLGVVTPTEAGAVGAVGALLLVLLQRRMTRQSMRLALVRTSNTSIMILFLMFGGLSFSFLVSAIGLPQELAEFIINLSPNRWVTLIGINVLLLILGCLLEPIGMLIITLPFIFPTLMAQGFDPIWLGVLITINVEIGMISPPVGLNLFVLKGAAGVGMSEVIKGAFPYIFVLLLGMVVIMLFPQLSLYIPSTIK